MKRLSILFLSTLLFAVAYASLQMPAFFSDNMLVQQQCVFRIWGTAPANGVVAVSVSWDKKNYKTLADANGQWEVKINTPSADNKLHSISVKADVKVQISNVILGDLWFCSGQSNMEMPMKGFKNQPIEGGNMDILRSKNSSIRLFTVKRNATLAPQTQVVGTWHEASPESVKEFSATAYYFGRLINSTMQVPIGLIHSAWGGSSAEAWMSEDMLRAFPEVKIPKTDADVKDKNRTPTMLYNAMVAPLLGLSIKGFIWYQGESNYDRAHSYAQMFATMVNGWRANWNATDTLPFYYCQIAPYDYALVTEKGKPVINAAFLREAQLKAEKLIPASGMAVLMDAGEEKCIHPAQKQLAGERLALLALSKTYAVKGVSAESPLYKSMEIKNDTVHLSFERADMWLTARNGESQCFTVAGADAVFYPAKAWIVRSKVLLKSENVTKPVAARYAFDNFVVGDLYSTEGIPVSSFRTDSW